MINKKYLMLSIFLLSLLTLSVVSASDNTTMDVIGLEKSDETISIEETQAIGQGKDDNLMDPDGGTFSDLQRKIDDANANSTITLENNYIYDEGFNTEGILISKDNITIDGGGKIIIDANKFSRIFNVVSSGVVFKNIYFINGHALGNGGAISGNSTAIGCIFNANYASEDGGAIYNVNAEGCTFIGNCAEHRGGGMYNGNATECIFRDNNYAGQAGGGMHTGDALNCIFTANGAADQGAGMYGGNAVGCSFENNYADNHGAAISNGNAVNCSFTGNHVNYYGGAIYMGSATGCNFSGNYAWLGGAIYSEKEEQPIVNCNFTGNWAYEGGAIYGKDMQYSILNSYFQENGALRGGGIYNGIATNCTFVKNAAREADDDDEGDGGAMYGGAAYYCIFDTNYANDGGNGAALSYSYAENCIFIKNHAAKLGGAIYYTNAVNCNFTENSASSGGGAMYQGNATNCTFDRNIIDGDGEHGGAIFHGNAYYCNFTGNHAYHGGAIHSGDAEYCIFIANSADGGGAGRYLDAKYCVFINCTSSDDGGAIHEGSAICCNFIGNKAEDDGGALYNANADNCTFNSNEAGGKGGAMYNGFANFCCFTMDVAGDGYETYGSSLFLCQYEFYAVWDEAFNDTELRKPSVVVPDKSQINVGDRIPIKLVYEGKEYNGIELKVDLEINTNLYYREIIRSGEEWVVDFQSQSLLSDEYLLYIDGIQGISGINSYSKEVYVNNPTIMNTNDISTTYGEDEDFVITLTDLANNPICNVTVNVDFIEVKNYTTDENGQIKISIKDLKPGTYTAKVTFDNESYEGASSMNSIFIDKQTVRLIPNSLVTTYNSDDVVIIELRDNKNNPINNMTLSVDFNGTKNYTTNENGQIIVSPKGLIPSTYRIDVVFEGSEIYHNSKNTGKVIIQKDFSKLIADTLVATYNDGKELTITLTDGYDNPIVNTVIFVDLNGTKPYITDEKGQIKISHENLTPNTYKVNVKFMEDSFYRESNVATTIIINKIGTNINADAVTREYIFANEYVFIITDDDGNPAGNVSVVIDLNGSDEFTTDENGQIRFYRYDNEKMLISITDYLGNPLKNVKLSVSLNGTKNYTTDSKGQIKVSTAGFAPGSYPINISFEGNEIYSESNSTAKLTVIKTKTKLTADSISTSYNENKYLVISLKDNLGNPVSGANVSVDLNGVKNYTTDSHGQINVSTGNLTPGTYIAKISFKENDYCFACDMQTIVDIKRTATQLKANPVKTIYKSDVFFVIDLKDIYGHPIANASVSVDLNGVKYYTTDENGEIKISTFDLTPNNYVAKIKFSENDFYDGSSIETDVIVEKSETKLSANSVSTTYGINKNLVISLKDAYNNPIANASVSVKLGTVKDYITDERGEIVIPSQNIIPGSYIAKISFNNEYYISSSIETSVVVNKISTKLTSEDVTTTYNVNKDLVISLKDNNGNPIPNVSVSINLGGVKKYNTDANGQIKVPIQKLVPNTYVAKISLNGNSHYGNSIDASIVVVKKATPKITAKSKTFKVKEKIKKYTIKLKNNKNQAMKKVKVYLKVNGKTYAAKTNSKGQATFKITKLTKKGKHTAAIIFNANKYYNKAAKKVKIVAK